MKTTLIRIGLVVALTSCAPRVAVDKAQRVDLNHYQTYAWMQSDIQAGQHPVYFNNLATQQVEKTINQVLNQRGLDSTSRNPDFLVGYHFFVEDKTRLVANNPVPVYGPYYGWGRWGFRGWDPRGGAGTPGDRCIRRKSTKPVRWSSTWSMPIPNNSSGAARFRTPSWIQPESTRS